MVHADSSLSFLDQIKFTYDNYWNVTAKHIWQTPYQLPDSKNGHFLRDYFCTGNTGPKHPLSNSEEGASGAD